MSNKLSELYPFLSIAHAYDLADKIGLSSFATTITPTRFVGLFCATEKDAIYFVLHFNDAKRWPADDPAVFLMVVPASQEVEDWLAENPSSGHLLEMVYIEFASATDQRQFERALWP
jgi:hypothetical protein